MMRVVPSLVMSNLLESLRAREKKPAYFNTFVTTVC